MLPFKTLLPVNPDAVTPIYRQIANGLVSLIRNGLIRPGFPLPASREMAALLQVHRKTIIAAYEELHAQDWIDILPRKGVRVSTLLPDLKPRTFKEVTKASGYAANTSFPFQQAGSFVSAAAKAAEHRLIINDGFPDPRIAPLDNLFRQYRDLHHRRGIERTMMYGEQAGSVHLRRAIAGFLSETRGINIQVDNVLTSHGAQMAIFIAAGLLLKPGSTVIVGEPNYFMANMIFEHFGAKLIRVAVDENGIDVDAIEKLCKKNKPALLYIIPHHHHPTTVTLSADRRMKLLEMIRAWHLPVIEDDYDYDFHYTSNPILPLASADHGGHVIYIGSLSKSLAPSLRIGFMAAAGNFIQAAAYQRRLIDIRGDNLFEDALAALFKNGQMQRHLKKSLKLYHDRRDRFCELLLEELGDIISFHKPDGGMAIWAKFNKKFPLPAIAKKASARGLYLSDGSFYNSGSVNYNALRMGFASLDKNEMEEAVSILKKVVLS